MDTPRHQHSPVGMSARIAAAIAGQALWGVVFVAMFRGIQAAFLPSGDLTGIDLSTHAARDRYMFWGFGVTLVLFDLILPAGLPRWRDRLLVFIIAGIASVVTFVGVFAGLLAG